MKLASLGIALALVALPPLAQASPSSARAAGDAPLQLGRYSTAVAAPAAQVAQPLEALVRLSYPRQTVHTVGDALEHTLARSGWRLVSASALEPQAAHLLTLPLPDSQRTLGPYTVRTVLEVLTGTPWQWHEDAVQRLAWFTLRAEYRPAPPSVATQLGNDAAEVAEAHPISSPEISSLDVAEDLGAAEKNARADRRASRTKAHFFPASGESSAQGVTPDTSR